MDLKQARDQYVKALVDAHVNQIARVLLRSPTNVDTLFMIGTGPFNKLALEESRVRREVRSRIKRLLK